MKRVVTLSAATAAAMFAGAVFAGDIDPGLQAMMDKVGPDGTISALIYLHEQMNTEGVEADLDARDATLAERHEVVVRGLQKVAADTQGNIVGSLNQLLDADRISDYEAYWVANLVRVDGPAAEIAAIVGREDVHVGYFNYEIEGITPTKMGPVDHGRVITDAAVGIKAIRADEVWADFGITGAGVVVSSLDTGTDGNHTALKDRWRGTADSRYSNNPEWAFFDPVTNRTKPFDAGSHGTHTMGTITGGQPGEEIGVAPGAQWITAAVIDRVSIQQTVADALLAFQWSVDPDGDPSTNWDVPAVSSNSWGLVTGHGYPPCDQTFWSVLDNCEAAGIVIVFAAGNEGGSGLRRPGDRAMTDYDTMAVAAVDANNANWPIASFSSRGPTNCTPNGSPAIKPDLAAPGVNVRSSVPGNGYANFSGTSMATPHIAGVVALLREVDPNLTSNELKQIMYDSCVDLGATGEDNSYGWGMIDAYVAVQAASGIKPACSNLKVDNLVAGQTATFTNTKNLIRGDYVTIVWGLGGNGTSFNNFAGYCATFGFNVSGPSRVVAEGYVDQSDSFVAQVKIPGNLSGMDIKFQSTKRYTCPDECMSNLWEGTIQ